MSWPIRARLTGWYCAVVLVVLASAALAIAVVQARTLDARLDGELRRLLLTVEAVMRNEFGEGLDLTGAAHEASTEVVTPGASVVVARLDGAPVQAWGTPLPAAWLPRPSSHADATTDVVTIGGAQYHAISHEVHDAGGSPYVVAVMASMAPLARQQAELVRALWIGLIVALGVAVAGGLLVARPALRPLTAMAEQAARVNGQTLSARLTVPNSRDELGQLGTTVNGLLDRLSASLMQQRQFMADASHQLRTPASILRTTAEVMLTKPQRTEQEYREALAIVHEQSVRLARLVDGMFLLSRAEAGGRALRPEPLYLEEVVGDCARALSIVGAGRQVTVATGGVTDVALVGDADLLRQLFMNLLDNAVRHTRAGGRVDVTVEAGTPVTVAIRDQGPGIADADRDRIFERFVRAHDGGDGAGLGLPIARWIAEVHGGSLTLRDSGASGSTFVVSLPA